MATILHALEILTHVLRFPRRILRKFRHVVPVLIVRVNENHGVMRRAASQRTGSGIENTIIFFSELGILPLPAIIGVMPDEKIPPDRLVFRCERVKRRNLVVFRHSWAGCLERVAARFKKKNSVAGLSESRRNRPAARSRAHNNVLVSSLRFP